ISDLSNLPATSTMPSLLSQSSPPTAGTRNISPTLNLPDDFTTATVPLMNPLDPPKDTLSATLLQASTITANSQPKPVTRPRPPTMPEPEVVYGRHPGSTTPTIAVSVSGLNG